MGDAERLGARVAFLRKRKGLTQEGLAEAIGVTTETVSRLERGAAAPSLARITDVARALDVRLREFFDFGDGATPEEQALDDLQALLRGRDLQLIATVSDVAAVLLRDWPEAPSLASASRRRPNKRASRKRMTRR